jgi:hypothetical protein
VLADDVPQGDVDAADGLEQEAALVAAQPHGGVQRLPDRLDVARVGADQLVAEQVVDDRLRHARRHRRLRLAPADDAGVGLDPDQAGVDALA